MTVRTTSKAKALMKALNVSVSVLPLLPKQEDNRRRVVLRLVLFQNVGHGSKQLLINSFRKFRDLGSSTPIRERLSLGRPEYFYLPYGDQN